MLVASLSPPRPGLDLRTVHARFMAYKVPLGQISLRVIRFPPVSISRAQRYRNFRQTSTFTELVEYSLCYEIVRFVTLIKKACRCALLRTKPVLVTSVQCIYLR
jgi:hypothetical protein